MSLGPSPVSQLAPPAEIATQREDHTRDPKDFPPDFSESNET